MLYSLPLAPGQKKQIVTLGWKRRESAKNAQSLVNEESLRAEIDHDRDVYEITKGGFSESLSGSSSSTTSSASASAGGMIGGVLFGVSGGVGHSSASSSQSGMRNMVASDLQKIQDRISQSASAVRSQRSTVIQTVAQNEELGVETESVANYNHCHAITIQYFEVLRHFKVRHRLADARECVFVPLMMTNFDLEKLLKWRDILSRRLIKPKLAKSFSSAQRVQSEWIGTSLPSATYADDPIIVANGQLAISFVIRRPADIEELVEDFERPIITTAGIVGYYKTKKMVLHEANWESLKPYMGTMTPTTFYSTYLEGKSNKDKIFHDALGQTIAREFVNSLQFSVADDSGRTIAGVNIDASLTSRYQPGGKLHISLRLNEPMSVPRKSLVYLRMTQSKPNIDQSEILVNSGSMRFRTAHFEGTLFNYPNLRDDLSSSDSVSVYCGPSQAELVNPKQEDVDFTNILIDHLNSHIEYYHKQIWLHMSAERRFMLLDGVLLDNPKAEGKSLASLVVNELIGIIGNSMVFPVAPGLNIDPNFTISDSLLDYYMVTGSEPSTISVPTEGVFAEAMMGSCNSCEKIDDSRFWRWEESPIPDSPTSIQTVSTDSRRADPGNLSANPMTNPIVNIQNAPSVPDPSGLNTAINLLGKGDSFRDATGLSSTQANSLAALQASYSATQSISQEAAKLETKRIEEAAKIEKAKLMERRMDKTFNAISNIPGMTEDEKKALYSKAVSSYMGAETAEESNPVKTAEKQVNAAAQTTAAVSKLVAEGKLPKEIGDNVIKDAWKAASNAMDQPKKEQSHWHHNSHQVQTCHPIVHSYIERKKS
ncbi:MAG: hypothetical protein IPP69_08545 [Flavobacteriales bacterium]|nr:hypothetical protein [Flavobacteriales bacterium]